MWVFCYCNNYDSILLYDNFNKIKNRGPDYSVLERIDKAYLGFHRLAINDLSSQGNQPFKKNGIYLICNGEIYNHIFLKEKYKFQTQSNSDCEVILYMYEKFGFEETCRQLDGVFSLIVYNDNTKKLYVSRDPYGVRPLFIGYNNLEELFFSSEMKAIEHFCIYIKQFKPGFYFEYNIFDKTIIYRNYYNFNLH